MHDFIIGNQIPSQYSSIFFYLY